MRSAIHQKCLECSGGYLTERERCPMKECPLYPYRNPKHTMKRGAGGSRVKAIREYCLGCSGGSAVERERCLLTSCPLYSFRNAKATKQNRIDESKNV